MYGCYSPVGGYTHADPGIINFQGKASPFLSLRSRFPLKPEVKKSSVVVVDDHQAADDIDDDNQTDVR